MLATGKPVVAVGLPELVPIARKGLIRLAATAEQFAAAIEAELREDDPASRGAAPRLRAPQHLGGPPSPAGRRDRGRSPPAEARRGRIGSPSTELEDDDMRRERTATILCTIGTRPEAIKMAPVIRAFRAAPWARCRVLFTAQHRELVNPMLAFFGIEPDIDLDIMRPDQTLVELTSRMLPAVHDAIARERPDMVLAQGDTTTVLATALASFYHKVPFGHVEAGLRTGRLYAPFPEEANRVLAGHLSRPPLRPDRRAPATTCIREGIDRRLDRRDRQHGDRRPAAGRRPRRADRRRPRPDDAARPGHGPPPRQLRRADPPDLPRGRASCTTGSPTSSSSGRSIPTPRSSPVVERAMSGLPRVRLCEPLAYGAVRLGDEAMPR